MSFATLAGNERNKQIIQRLLQQGASPNEASGPIGRTLIFAGPAGVGKRQFALAMAKASNCLEALPHRAPDSCDQCPTCRRIDEGTYGDVIVVAPDGQFIKIAQTRAMNDEVFYLPREGRQRFFIIDEADRLREESANSLLKTLEEPPPTSTIILITARPDSLLPTIRSRAQRLNFSPLTLPELEAYLALHYPRPKEENALLARLAGGCIGAALAIDLSVYRQERRILIELLELLAENRQRHRIMKAAEYISNKEKQDFEVAIESINGLLRDLVVLSTTVGEATVVNIDLVDRLKDLALRLGTRRLILWFEQFNILRRQLRVNVNRQLATEALLLRLQYSATLA
ncbi:MAG: ATP-binding protein [Acidobacteriota bacterium]